jgi:sugar (pentulose or hexulose) kinase
MTIVLGIDLATGDARVLAVDADTGEHLAEHSRPLGWVAEDGAREQPAVYGAVARDLIAAVVFGLGARCREIRALSITGTSGTVVPTDTDGTPVGNAILYNDPRGGDEYATLVSAGLAERPSQALARTAWMHSHTPAARYLFTADVVAAALAEVVLPADTSHALKSGIDAVAGRWNLEALELLGVPERTLPALVGPARVIGTVSARVSETLGLPSGVLIVSGMTDGSTAQLATGAIRDGDTVGVLGTTLVLKAAAATAVTDLASGIYSHVAPDGAFWVGGASNTGAGVLRSGITAGLPVQETDSAARAMGASSVVAYPLIAPGERFPIVDPGFVGFAVDKRGRPVEFTDPVLRFRAVLEGVAYVERLGLERLAGLGVAGGRHYLGGGASSSSIWNVIRASVLARDVIVPHNRSSAFGAAILAIVGLTGDDVQDVAERLARPAQIIEPDPALVPVLERGYTLFSAALASGHSNFR